MTDDNVTVLPQKPMSTSTAIHKVMDILGIHNDTLNSVLTVTQDILGREDKTIKVIKVLLVWNVILTACCVWLILK